MTVNVVAVAAVTRALLPALRSAHGLVITVNSGSGLTATPASGAYCASKFALRAFSDSLRQEEREHGVRVTVAAPGPRRHRHAARARRVRGRGLRRARLPRRRLGRAGSPAGHRRRPGRERRHGLGAPPRLAPRHRLTPCTRNTPGNGQRTGVATGALDRYRVCCRGGGVRCGWLRASARGRAGRRRAPRRGRPRAASRADACGSRPRRPRRRPSPLSARCSSTLGARLGAAPGTRCSSRNEPRPSARCRCASRSGRARRAIASASEPAVAVCDRSSVTLS